MLSSLESPLTVLLPQAACRTITGAATSELAADVIVGAGAPELLVEVLCTSRNLELLEAAVVALLQVPYTVLVLPARL
jgi:hypothetical protein